MNDADADLVYFLACLHRMSDADLLDELGMDARKWAQKFCDLQGGRVVDGNAPDENDDRTINVGTLIGWFANAIMAGYDRGYQKGSDSGLLTLGRELERIAKGQA
ncbi:MAG: hypothetical protein DI537_45540 [Stutzerimonas stutzeri]|nr:MAG: hypothetical protein DI537_45540 [Stutzerimonas stutzeri]